MARGADHEAEPIAAGAAARALEALLTEVARIRLHGITPRQLAQALSSLKVGPYAFSITL